MSVFLAVLPFLPVLFIQDLHMSPEQNLISRKMDNPLSSPDSQHNSQNEPATDKTSSGLNKTVKFDESQIITKPVEENGSHELKEQTEDNVIQDLNEPVKLSQSELIIEPAKENEPQKLNEQTKDSEPQDQPTRDHSLQNMNEVVVESKSLNQIAQDRTVPELKNETEAKQETPEKTLLDQEKSPLPSSFSGQEVIPTDDIPAPRPILDGNDQGLPEQAVDNEPRAIKVQEKTVVEEKQAVNNEPQAIKAQKKTVVEEKQAVDNKPQAIEAQEKTVVEETEQQPQYKKEGPPQIIITSVPEKILKIEKAGVPSLHVKKPSSPSSSYRSLSARPMLSRNPPQLAKAALYPKPKLQTANKATQVRIRTFVKKITWVHAAIPGHSCMMSHSN
uniref:Uncharacterized protein n=1 Tax=Sphaerodactylus townsendi TaxID=933632 RepID=A0ACB8ETG1_9SAUR